MSWIRQLGRFCLLVGYIYLAEVLCESSFFWSVFVFGFRSGIFGNCYYFVLLSFSCSLLRICENVLQVRLEFLGKTRDDFICVINLFGF